MKNDVKNSFSDRLIKKTRELGNPICMGLDPNPNLIPKIFKNKNSSVTISNIENFLSEILELAVGKVVAIKPQVAFFEQLGPEGMSLLIKISRMAHNSDLLVIMDAKRGDIESSSKAYADAWIGRNATFPSDALTVNPWMGLDTLKPFIEVASKNKSGIFILLRTSNEGASDLQELLIDEEPLYIYLAKLLNPIIKKNLGDIGYSNIGLVVGATNPDQATLIRSIIPEALFLIPGFGAQGASAKEACSGLIKNNGFYEGGLINSSRGLIFPDNATKSDSIKDWKIAINKSINLMKVQIKA